MTTLNLGDHNIDLTGAPPAKYLSAPTRKLLVARDAVFEKVVDFEADYLHFFDSTWERYFAAEDEKAGAEAAAAGVDPLSIPSRLAEARDQRPRLLGALKTMVGELRRADKAFKAALLAELDDIAEKFEADAAAAAQKYVEAQAKADEARQRWGAMLRYRQWVVGRIHGHHRSECPPEISEAPPKRYNGQDATDIYGHKPLRGEAEVRDIERSYGGGR